MYRAFQLRFSFLLATSLLVIASATGYSVQAAEESCCVDEDIAAVFLHKVSYSREWPEAFPFTLADDQLEFVAAATSGVGQGSLVVGLKSQLSIDATLQVLGAALSAADWRQVPTGASTQQWMSRGFISRQIRAVANNQQYCRAQDGVMSIRVRESTTGTVVSLSNYPIHSGQNCAEFIKSHQQDQNPEMGMQRYLPLLELPQGADADGRSSGSGGSTYDAHAGMTVKTEMSGTDLLRSFDAQMTDQQWQLDSRFNGSFLSGSVWQREVDGRTIGLVLTAINASRGLGLRMELSFL